MDELPLLINRALARNPAEVELLMGLLRAVAQDVPVVRWLISGSIGLEPVLHRAGLTGMITHLRAYPIDAWDAATTRGAVEALAEAMNLHLATGTGQAVHAELGLGVPYHVQLLMDEVRRDADRRGDRRVSPADVTRVYRGPLVGAVRAHLMHLESRLLIVLGEGDPLRLARDLLTQAAVGERLTAEEAMALAEDVVEDEAQRGAILREVLEILEHDAYLDRDRGGWRFRSRLVRDWWRQGNELGFLPPTAPAAAVSLPVHNVAQLATTTSATASAPASTSWPSWWPTSPSTAVPDTRWSSAPGAWASRCCCGGWRSRWPTTLTCPPAGSRSSCPRSCTR